jgi:carboxymethylenebutenolidase
MQENLTDIPADGGFIDTFITRPAQNGPFPAVIIYMDVWGLREELFDVARRIATVGYCCLVPNLYYRQGKIRNEFRNRKGEMITLDSLEPEQKKLVLAPLERLTDAMVVDDTAAILRYIDGDAGVRRGAAGGIGYCMGGRHVFRAAANFPQRFKASASLHGTDLVIEGENSPHLAMSKAQGEIYCGFGEEDRHTPKSTVETLERTFSSFNGWGARYVYEVHKGAEHGYALPDRDVFDKQAANRDWEIIFPIFERQLHSASN